MSEELIKAAKNLRKYMARGQVNAEANQQFMAAVDALAAAPTAPEPDTAGLVGLLPWQLKGTAAHIRKVYPLLGADADYMEQAAAALLAQAAQIAALQSDVERHMTIANEHVNEVESLRREVDGLQSKIDWLMLEYCPEEMTPEQREEWARHQKPVSAEQSAKIAVTPADLTARREG